MNRCIATIEEATPTWLTEVLSQKGCLPRGNVRSLTVTRVHDEQLYSLGYSLAVEYSSEVSASAPTHLFLKLPKLHASVDPVFFAKSVEREIHLYQTAASLHQPLPIIPCYDAAYDADRQVYHLLLDDLSETHDQPSWHLSIADHYVIQTVESLAAFHAYWREHPYLGSRMSALPTTASLQQEMIRLWTVFPQFVEDLEDHLSREDQRVYERLLATLPVLWEKRIERSGQTLVHGDPHFWNFFYPRDPRKHQTYLFDWQTYRISPGTHDLAYTLVLRYPHRTKANEQDLVKRYHERLLAYGTTGYSWDQCWYEYRRSVAEQLLVTLNWVGWASNSRYVRRALIGFSELACDEFLH